MSRVASAQTHGHHVSMSSALDVVNGVGSVAGIIGIGYQIYTTQRDRAARRRSLAPAGVSTEIRPRSAAPSAAPHRPTPAGSVAAPADAGITDQVSRAETAGARSAIPAPASWFDLAAPWLMGGYLWVMALGGFSYIDDLGLAGGTSEAVETQLRYTAVLLVINTILAGALAYRHTPVRPLKVRVWVYGLGGLASIAVAIGLAAKYSPMIF